MVFMRSCEGWDREPQVLLCCQKTQCLTHNAAEVRQLGIPAGDLSPIPCFSAQRDSQGAGSAGLARAHAVLVGVVPVATVALLVALAGAAMHRRYRRAIAEAAQQARRGGDEDFERAAALARSSASLRSAHGKLASSGRKSSASGPLRTGAADAGDARSSGGWPSSGGHTPFESARDTAAAERARRPGQPHRANGNVRRRVVLQYF